MPRFRSAEDEQRYLALRAEAYTRLVGHAPVQIAAEVMRNFGKMESMAHFEGVRQGLAIAQLFILHEGTDGLPTLNDLNLANPAEALARVYGFADTPLARCEEALLEKAEQRSDLSPGVFDAKDFTWLNADPIKMAPQTLAEANLSRVPVSAPEPTLEPVDETDHLARRQIDFSALDEILASDSPETLLADCESDETAPTDESPEMIEKLRRHITSRMDAGWKPERYDELVLALHRELQIDAFILDLQLSSHVGRTMLDQCGLIGLHPGMGVLFNQAGFQTT